MITRTLATAATLAALLATPALAQHQHHRSPTDSADARMGGGMQMMHGSMTGGSMHMMRGGMMGMMQSMHPGPGTLLAAADALDLTEDQQARLRALQDESEHQGHMQAAMAIHREAAQALHGESPDLGAYEHALQEASDHMVQAHLAMTRTALQARDVLTAEQREKLHGAMSMMHQMRGGGMDAGGHGGHR